MPGADTNPVGTLQEHAQSKGGVFPQYKLLQAVGESHCPNFTMEVKFGDLMAEGMATNKKQAKQEAARNILALIRGENESMKNEQSDMEDVTNQEDAGNKTREEQVITDNKPALDQKVFTGNKIGELQEFCMSRGIGVPVYKDGETTGPSHKRHFTMVCVMGTVEKLGEGGTKKEAKRQAAGAVLEEISSAAEKIAETEGKDPNDCNEGEILITDKMETDSSQFIDGSRDVVKNGENDFETKEPNCDMDAYNQKLEELNIGVLEDQDKENTPEDVDD
eukprot:GFUD01037052.1.p1 GENE.GFUD01037052.1~~GFUD01037052.1.p1  ORF type:complete len:277 (+),score=108.86 GFUD01037052.1:89-919(+)